MRQSHWPQSIFFQRFPRSWLEISSRFFCSFLTESFSIGNEYLKIAWGSVTASPWAKIADAWGCQPNKPAGKKNLFLCVHKFIFDWNADIKIKDKPKLLITKVYVLSICSPLSTFLYFQWYSIALNSGRLENRRLET